MAAQRILIIAAAPKDKQRLRIDEEVRSIRTHLRTSRHVDELELHYLGAAQLSDIPSMLRTIRPQFVHFAGHQNRESNSLIFEDEGRSSREVSAERFAEFFKPLAGHIRCLFLSTCYLGTQAAILGRHVQHVIGMTGLATDSMLAQFSGEFYGAITEGRDVADAFESAQLSLDGVPDLQQAAPILFSKEPQQPAALDRADSVMAFASSAGPRLLILSAEPLDKHRLDIDLEAREIRRSLQEAHANAEITMLYSPAIRLPDITREIRNWRPTIVHIAVYTGADSKMTFLNSEGTSHPVDAETLASVLKSAGRQANIGCVVLNTPRSAQAAQLIAQDVPFAIGFEGNQTNEDAISFACEFYAALAAEASIEESFHSAETKLQSEKSRAVPRLFRKPISSHQDSMSPLRSDMADPTSTPVDFLILTPLKEEREAVLAHLPNPQRLPPDEEDVRVYYQVELPTVLPGGSEGRYRVIVTSPLGMGRTEAATVTTDAIRRWKPRYVLLVGIAGGDPDEVELGDVLIAEQFVDYEQQKMTDAGASIRYQNYRADARLYGVVQHLTGWESAVKEARPQKGKPSCHFGVVITGDKVQAASDALKPYKSDWPKLIGVEMEAGGVAAAAWEAPSKPGILMVRGVSDLADANKGSARVKKWRPYACDVAAAYTVAFLQSGPVTLTASTRTSKAPTPTTTRPTRDSLRKLLVEVLRLDSDLDAFCLDYFHETSQRISNGMDREQKRNVLLEREDPTEIWDRLKQGYPKACEKYAHLVQFER